MLRIGLNPNGKAEIPGVLNMVRPQGKTATRLTTGLTLKTGEKPDSGPVDTVHLGRDSFRPPKAGTYVPPNLSPKPGPSPALPRANAFKFDEENLADYRTAEKAALASEEGEQVWWRFQKLTARLKLKQLSNEIPAENFDQYLAVAASSGNLGGSNRINELITKLEGLSSDQSNLANYISAAHASMFSKTTTYSLTLLGSPTNSAANQVIVNRLGDFLSAAGPLTAADLTKFLTAAAGAGDRLGDFLTQESKLSGDNLAGFLTAASAAGTRLGDFLTQEGRLSGDNLTSFLTVAAGAGDRLGDFLTGLQKFDQDYATRLKNAQRDYFRQISSSGEELFRQAGNSYQDFLDRIREGQADKLTKYLAATEAALKIDRLDDFLTQEARLSGGNLTSFLTVAAGAGDRLGDFLTRVRNLDGDLLTRLKNPGPDHLTGFLAAAGKALAIGRLGAFLTRESSLSGVNLTRFLLVADLREDVLGDFLTQAERLTGEDLTNFLATAAAEKSGNLGRFLNQLGGLTADNLTNFLFTAGSASEINRFGEFLEQADYFQHRPDAGDFSAYLSSAAAAAAENRLDDFLTQEWIEAAQAG